MVCATLQVQAGTFESFGGAWDELAERTPGATVFLSRPWHEAWWRHFGAGAQPLLLGFRESDRLTAIAPLMVRDRIVSFLGGADLVDYHDILSADADAGAISRELMGELDGRDDWDRVELLSMPDWSPFTRAIPDAARSHAWDVQVEFEDVAPGLEIPQSWDEYLAGLRKKDRHELRRKIRRLEASGDVVQFECVSAPDIEASLDEFIRLHRLSSPEKAEFMTPERERFFRDVAARLAGEGAVRLYFTKIDGCAVAVSMCFEYGGSRLVYNSGFDPEYRDLSAGLVNHANFLDCCIRDNVKYADFMRGNERYKYNLGATDRELYRVTISRAAA